MLSKDKENKLLELFMSIDDFCIALENWKQNQPQFCHSVTRHPEMSDSEMITILVFYQWSGYKCFQYYYEHLVAIDLKSDFPKQVTYPRFVTLIPRLLPGLFLFLQWNILLSHRTGCYFIDSKKLPVCHNRRIHNHKVFVEYARRGKSSTGWFYGFKVHLVINQMGQLVSVLFTSANIADNNHKVLRHLLSKLKGQCFGDKGYLTKLFEEFYSQGLQLVTKVRAKMKNQLLPLTDKIKLRKRAVIESVNDILTSVFDLEHTRHRSPVNAMAHMISALIAYCFYEDKPTVFIPNKDQLLIE
jgi:hypothetical protein